MSLYERSLATTKKNIAAKQQAILRDQANLERLGGKLKEAQEALAKLKEAS